MLDNIDNHFDTMRYTFKKNLLADLCMITIAKCLSIIFFNYQERSRNQSA